MRAITLCVVVLLLAVATPSHAGDLSAFGSASLIPIPGLFAPFDYGGGDATMVTATLDTTTANTTLIIQGMLTASADTVEAYGIAMRPLVNGQNLPAIIRDFTYGNCEVNRACNVTGIWYMNVDAAVPVHNCNRGPNNGAACTVDSECPAGSCSMIAYGEPMTVELRGGASQGTCVGGPNASQPCLGNSACPSSTCNMARLPNGYITLVVQVVQNNATIPPTEANTGFVPPDKATSKCEDKTTKLAANLAKAISKCHVKAADTAFKMGSFDEEACEDAAKTKYDGKSAALICPTCLNLGARATIRDATESFLDQINGSVYCLGTTPLPE